MKFRTRIPGLLASAALAFTGIANATDTHSRGERGGLSTQAASELRARGLDKYLGKFTPATSENAGGGWSKHTWNPQSGNGPICILGTPYTAFTKAKDPRKVLVYLNGGGACWKDFYNCTPVADATPPAATGIFADGLNNGTQFIENAFEDYSIVYGSYCDGSVFAGDNTVVDPDYAVPNPADPANPLKPGVRHHRGLRNLSAVVDLAKAHFPHADKVVVAGSSAGGTGAAVWAPFLARFAWGNDTHLSVFNDAGPLFVNAAVEPITGDIAKRAADWKHGQFLPASCTACSDQTHFTHLVSWRLQNDRGVRDSYYVTDGDSTLRFFLRIPTQAQFRPFVLALTQSVVDAHPDRFRRFVRSGSDLHTSLRLPIFYTAAIYGLPLHGWTEDFIDRRADRDRRNRWKDKVENLVALP